MAHKYSFGTDPIFCHDFNSDNSHIAISPNNHEIHLYKQVDKIWVKYQTLEEHSQRVTGIAWARKTNKIATVSQDRNAYVWEMITDNFGSLLWKPFMVLVRLNRAATCVSWSPFENKFAVGSGARLLSICFFEKEQDWWVGKHIKKPIQSSITCIDWHPNNCLISAGSTDFKTRVFSGYIKEVDEKPEPTVWGKKMIFANLMAEFKNGNGGWIHAVSFSADGTKLAWTAHDCTVSVVDMACASQVVARVRHDRLPFLTMSWLSDSSLLTAGHDCVLVLFSFVGGELRFQCDVDVKSERLESKFSAMKKFQSFDKKATTEEDSALDTTHQNSITQIRVVEGDKSAVRKLSTVGMDGLMVLWDWLALEKRFENLRIR